MKVCVFIFLLATRFFLSTAQAANDSDTTLRTTIHYAPDTKEIEIDGNISSGMLNDVKNLNNQFHFETMIINSLGGESGAGIELAKLIKSEHMTLVVDGACMSACANYLFVAAERKKVLPGSAVVIHGSVSTGLVHFSSIPEAERKVLNDSAAQEREFYKSIDMKYGLLASYDNFVSKLEKNHMIDQVKNETGGPTCPAFRGWAPTEDELISWGVKGIVEFWYPKNPEDFLLIEKKINLPSKYIFFGDFKALSALCKPPQ